MAIKVKLRKKSISGGKTSLYLDFYPPIPHPQTGRPTRREFLGQYLFETPKSIIERQHNQTTSMLAEQIRQKRENQLNKPEIYSNYELELLKKKELGEQSFVTYFKKLADKRKASNHDNWISAYNYLESFVYEFAGGRLSFSILDERICNDFKDYLLSAKRSRNENTTLARNSASSYFNKFKAALRQSYKDGLLQTDLNARISPIKQEETQRNFLTLEELNSLAQTDCSVSLLKRAALFSALTGMRFSDIQKLRWSEINYSESTGYSIHFTQQKTKGAEVLPISDQAYSLLGEPGQPETKIFTGLVYSAHENKHLRQWVEKAGISKHITFHCFRHTFATLQLSEGTDIYTVSKMLGHRDLKTTQIYAKIIDQTKREAANRIKINL